MLNISGEGYGDEPHIAALLEDKKLKELRLLVKQRNLICLYAMTPVIQIMWDSSHDTPR
jgi:hypothetical protein